MVPYDIWGCIHRAGFLRRLNTPTSPKQASKHFFFFFLKGLEEEMLLKKAAGVGHLQPEGALLFHGERRLSLFFPTTPKTPEPLGLPKG